MKTKVNQQQQGTAFQRNKEKRLKWLNQGIESKPFHLLEGEKELHVLAEEQWREAPHPVHRCHETPRHLEFPGAEETVTKNFRSRGFF